MNLIIKHLMVSIKQFSKTGKVFVLSLLLLSILSSRDEVLMAQDSKPSRQSAESAWNSGDYETAYSNYNGLLMMYSRDPLYAYYTGACLVKLDRDTQRSVTLLRSALHSSQSVKTVPDEVWFYYGRALQLSGSYREASTAYEKYTKVAGKKKAQLNNTQQFIDQCAKSMGAHDSSANQTAPVSEKTVKTEKQHISSSVWHKNDYDRKIYYIERYNSKSDSLLRIAQGIKNQIDKSPGEVKGLMRSRVVELETQAGRYLSSADSIRMILSNDGVDKIADTGSNTGYESDNKEDVTVNETDKPLKDIYVAKSKETEVTVPGEYDIQLTRAMKLQFTSDSLNRAAAGLRRTAETVTRSEGTSLLESALKLETEALKCQSEADKILMKLEPGMPDIEKVDEKVAAKYEIEVKDDAKEEIKTEVNVEEKSDEKTNVEIIDKTVMTSESGVFSSFEIRSVPAYTTSDPVPVGSSDTKGLVYHIQLAAFRNPVSPSYFRNLYPVFGKLNSTNGVTYYYTGLFRTHEAATSSLPSVRSNGFADAFVVAFIDEVQVSMERAAQAEGYWSGIPLFYTEKQMTEKAAQVNKEPVPAGTLVLRAEVLRSVKPVKSDVMDKIELLAGNKPLDIVKNNKGETIILVGKFITFESAEEYVSLLNRNGYSNAKVAAWVGNSEIPVESAKELINRISNE